MIKRHIGKNIIKFSKQYPVVMLTGPRQSGKTTLCKKIFPDKEYVSLENPDDREFALSDPKGFLSQYKKSIIIDEAQRAPDLFSYIQGIVDEKKRTECLFLLAVKTFNCHIKLHSHLQEEQPFLNYNRIAKTSF